VHASNDEIVNIPKVKCNSLLKESNGTFHNSLTSSWTSSRANCRKYSSLFDLNTANNRQYFISAIEQLTYTSIQDKQDHVCFKNNLITKNNGSV